MPAGQTGDERSESLKPFADCINEHLELGLIQAWSVKGFREWSIKDQAYKLGSPDDPYLPAFIRGMTELEEYVGADGKISLICDDDMETALKVYFHYRALRVAHDQVRDKTISLTFADDKHFPALQAADLISYMARIHARWHMFKKPHDFRKLYDYLVDPVESRKMEWRLLYMSDEDQRRIIGKVLDR